jgi:hypothetical protein
MNKIIDKNKLPRNLGALLDAMIDVLSKNGMNKEMLEVLMDPSADKINDIAVRDGSPARANNNLMLGLAFFSDAYRSYDVNRFLAAMSKKDVADISCYNRDAYRAAECFRRLGAECNLRDERGEIVNMTR